MHSRLCLKGQLLCACTLFVQFNLFLLALNCFLLYSKIKSCLHCHGTELLLLCHLFPLASDSLKPTHSPWPACCVACLLLGHKFDRSSEWIHGGCGQMHRRPWPWWSHDSWCQRKPKRQGRWHSQFQGSHPSSLQPRDTPINLWSPRIHLALWLLQSIYVLRWEQRASLSGHIQTTWNWQALSLLWYHY